MLKTQIESILFISPKPLTVKNLLNAVKTEEQAHTEEEIMTAVAELKLKYDFPESGVHLIEAGDGFQFVSNPECADLVKKFLKEDMTGELTPASLETLTVIAYRGPITKPELEQIRGVNCTLIIRNLLLRGLIIADENKQNMQTYFQVTTDFLKHLGLNSAEELPDFARLHEAENLEQYLQQASRPLQNEEPPV